MSPWMRPDKCRCCAGVGDHPCGHECDSCDGSGKRDRTAQSCTVPHGADCRCDWGQET